MSQSVSQSVTMFSSLSVSMALNQSNNLLYFIPCTEMTANTIASVNQNSQNQMNKNNKVQKNIVLTLLVVSLCFILCWVWRITQFLLENLGIQDATKNYGGFVHEFGTLAIFTNILTNPFIYFITLKNFREAAKEVLCKK